MKIPPFKEINRPNKNGYWIHPKTKEAYGGQYISPLLIPNLQKVEKCLKFEGLHYQSYPQNLSLYQSLEKLLI